MRQAFLYKGNIITREVPIPSVRQGYALIRTEYSCISAGTEITSVKSSGKSLLKRIIERPKLLKRGIKMIKNRGFRVVFNTIKSTNGSGFGNAIGYSASGIVMNASNLDNNLKTGQRVAIVGAMYASHAEYNITPRNLIIPVPDCVSLEDASTAALGSIAMQGYRQLSPNPGDTVVVMGIGFIGQLTVQMLLASACTVIGIDINQGRMDIAQKAYNIPVLNGSDPMLPEKVYMLTDGKGADGVIFTAATTSSSPMSSCFKMLRKKGRFVLVGVSGMEIKREDIYQKEIDFRISTSYGPGRYDKTYEEQGIDYPYEYVRFTERRNMEAYLDMIAKGVLSISDMSISINDIDNAGKAYEELQKSDPPMVSLLHYGEKNHSAGQNIILKEDCSDHTGAVVCALIGAGNYAKNIHLPNMSEVPDKFYLKAVMNRSAVSAASVANQYNAEYYTTNIDDILNDSGIQLVLICTRHDSHARYAIKAMRAGKHVFVEKPPAVNLDELNELMQTIKETGKFFLVGYNRRFSKYAKKIKSCIENRQGKLFIEYTMNAGYIPYDHWVHTSQGGGRIIGEGCHIIDLFIYLVGSEIENISTNKLYFTKNYYRSNDNLSATLTFKDGSIAVLNYFSVGSKALSKEMMRILFDGKEIVLDDYMNLMGNGIKVRKLNNSEPDKGQKNLLKILYDSVKGNNPYPIPLNEIWQTSIATFLIDNQQDVLVNEMKPKSESVSRINIDVVEESANVRT